MTSFARNGNSWEAKQILPPNFVRHSDRAPTRIFGQIRHLRIKLRNPTRILNYRWIQTPVTPLWAGFCARLRSSPRATPKTRVVSAN